MNLLKILLLSSFCLSQEFSWEKIDQIREGYQYLINSNLNGDLIAGGIQFNENYEMQLYFKDNNGAWIEVLGNELVTTMIGDVLITETQNIYVCDFAMGLYRTIDLGINWSAPSEISFDGCSAFKIHENGTFFMGMTYTGIGFIHRSIDNGSTWEALPLPYYENNYPVEYIDFDNEGNIFLGTINGIYRSTDNGENWQKMNNGINGEHISSLFIDENDNIYIYTTYSSMVDGMYFSNDNAESWISIPMPGYYVVDLLVKNNIIMIIDGYNNIQLTEDLGNTWVTSNDGLNDYSLFSLHLGYNDIIYAGGRYIHYAYNNFDECQFIGDLNYDSLLNVIDVILIVNCILDSNCGECSDINEDGENNVIDIILLLNLILDLEQLTHTQKLILFK